MVFSGVHGAHGFTGGLGLRVQGDWKGLQGLPEGFRRAAPECYDHRCDAVYT